MIAPAKRAVRRLGAKAMVRLGVPRLAQRLLYPKRLTILMYHAVIDRPLPFEDWCFIPRSEFREQLRYLKRHFDVLPLSTAVARLQTGQIERPAVAITFDDGFQNNHDTAFPILQELDVPATIFLVTDLVDTDRTTWACQLHRALAETTEATLSWDGRPLDLSTTNAKVAASRVLSDELRELPQDTLMARLASLCDKLGVDKEPLPEDSPYRMLSSTAVRLMQESGLVEFGGHTRNHAIVSRLPSDACRQEIGGSIEGVAALTGRPCRLFSYPNGRAQDYDARAVAILEDCGVEAAVTTVLGGNAPSTPPLELRRIGIGPALSMTQLSLRSHLWYGERG